MSENELFVDKPKIVYSVESLHSGKINVWKHGKGFVLEVGGYQQSVSLNIPTLRDRYWYKATEEVGKLLIDPQKALVIGVGGGTVLHLLSYKFPDLKITGVEIDPEVIKIAREFFDLDKVGGLEVVLKDGATYVFGYEGEPFDLTFVDAYTGGNFPLHFEERGFLEKLQKITKKSGLIVINRASGFDKKTFEELLYKVFAKVEVVKIPLPGFLGGMGGNYLYLCS